MKKVELLPPLKWAGGKRWQVPHLEPLWRHYQHRRLVEPFCGGLAVTLGLNPERALLNDVNPHLINFYRWLKSGLAPTIPMVNDRAAYYESRERFNALVADGRGDNAEAAALFYYLNRTGYNGLCRFNSKGGFNVPFGKYKTINYRNAFEDYRSGFRKWDFRCADFEQLDLEPGDFIYADPPYDVEFTHYSKGGFDWADQERAAEWLAKHQGPVVLANQATERIQALYMSSGFRLHLLQAPRRISCNGDRAPVLEIVATRNLDHGT